MLFIILTSPTSSSTFSITQPATQFQALMVGCNENSVPDWLQILLAEKFFEPCCVHGDSKKNEKNVFCLDCSIAVCSHCVDVHPCPHRLLQIRRYVYHDVVRLGDAQKLMNCSSVQPYTTNSAKVVFLKQRPMCRPFRGSGSFCKTCDRSLQASFLFCSLSCKVRHLVSTKAEIKRHVYDCQFLQQFDEEGEESFSDRVTPDSVLDSPSSGSTTTSAATLSLRGALACTATTRRKRSTVAVPRTFYRPVISPAAESAGRRKSVPHRSPLY